MTFHNLVRDVPRPITIFSSLLNKKDHFYTKMEINKKYIQFYKMWILSKICIYHFPDRLSRGFVYIKLATSLNYPQLASLYSYCYWHV